MTNHEHIVKMLIRPVRPAERHRYHSETNAIVDIDEVIRLREAVLWLADRVDELEQDITELWLRKTGVRRKN